MPPPNDARRAVLADATIALLASDGVHGVTHRTVERAAGLPVGTASNYFRSREALLVAAAERVVERHRADMDAAAAQSGPADPVSLIAESLHAAATTHRDRYLAIFELRLEGLRRPALAATLEGLGVAMVAFTAEHHIRVGLSFPPERVAAMVTLYGGALFTLVTGDPAGTTKAAARELAAAIVRTATG